MLEIAQIKNNQERTISGLKKRGIKEASSLINEVLAVDDERKNVQGKRDSALAEANTLAKQIGQLMQSGEKEKANTIKEKTALLKIESKTLGETVVELEKKLKDLLYNIPNVPNEDVPEGKGADDNVVVHEFVQAPKL